MVITHERGAREDRQQDDQRVADGDPKPVQPLVPAFVRDLVGTVLLQPRGRLRFAEAGRRGAELFQNHGGFLHGRVADGAGAFLLGQVFLIRHK